MRGSIAHVKMLAKQGILTEDERDQIIAGIEGILSDVERGVLEIRINMRIFTALWRQHLLIVLENRARNCIQEEAGMIRLHWI